MTSSSSSSINSDGILQYNPSLKTVLFELLFIFLNFCKSSFVEPIEL